jgi:hypothetical protein
MKDEGVKGEERKLDAELKRLGIKTRIYHFTTRCSPFRGITIAVADSNSWSDMREILDTVRYALKVGDGTQIQLNFSLIEPAARTLKALRERGIYGVAICDPSDNFNRQEGRNKAKGRLVQHLKLVEKERKK